MRPIETVRTTFFNTLHDSLNGEIQGVAFVDRLQEASAGIEPPTTDSPAENLAYALLTSGKKNIPYRTRREYAKKSLDSTRNIVLQGLSKGHMIDLQNVKSQAEELSSAFITDAVGVASRYPASADTKTSQRTFLEIINPNKESFEDIVVSISVLFDLFEPYLLDRLLELDIYHPDVLSRQVETMAEDFRLLLGFSKSLEYVAEILIEGKSQLPVQELAERLFSTGPLFAKMVQTFADSVPLTSPTVKNLAQTLQAAFQEDIAPPTSEELAEIQADLPRGLKFEQTISSASIAHVVGVESDLGEKMAVKVARPGIERTLDKNIRLFQLLDKVFISFVNEHARNCEAGGEWNAVQEALPFFMEIAKANIQRELDFDQEAVVQKRAGVIFERHKQIAVPAVIDGYSNKQHITMERIDGTRIEKLPTNAAYLRNIFVFAAELWRNHFWHSNPHGGNVKGREDGSIVVYDWGQNTEIPAGFIPNLRRYLFALARKNPKALAKAYCRIQSQDHNRLSEEEVTSIAREVFEARKKIPVDLSNNEKKGRVERMIEDLMDTQQMLTFTLALRHQNVMDTRYLYFISSVVDLSKVVEAELAKPEYQEGRKKLKTIAQCIAGAVKEVYLI